MRDQKDAGEQINAAIDRAQRFLTLASLVTVVLAAVATAMSARLYALRHLDTVALMKSIGGTQAFIVRTSLIQLIAIVARHHARRLAARLRRPAGAGAAVARAGGRRAAAARIDAGLARRADLGDGGVRLRAAAPLAAQAHAADPGAAPRPAAAGAVHRPSPTRVAVAALVGMIYAIVRDLKLVGFIVGGLAALSVVGGAHGLGAGRARRRASAAPPGVAWRYGLANISRRGAESVIQIVGFGLGLMVLLLLTVVRTDLLTAWQRTIPGGRAELLPDQHRPADLARHAGVHRDRDRRQAHFLPFIRGRLTAINGTPVADLKVRDVQGAATSSAASRTSPGRRTLPESNRSAPASGGARTTAASRRCRCEEDVARELGVKLGDSMTFNVGGEEFTAPVTSIRYIEWDSFAPNFFLMLSPGLAGTCRRPTSRASTCRRRSGKLLNNLVRKFPGVTVFDLEAILAQVRLVVDRASLSVQYVFLFTLLAGVMVLLAAVQVTRDERRFESAILHALGADRRTILQGVAVEFTTLARSGRRARRARRHRRRPGARGEGLRPRLHREPAGCGPRACCSAAFSSGLTGTLATRKAVNEPPVAVLRDA